MMIRARSVFLVLGSAGLISMGALARQPRLTAAFPNLTFDKPVDLQNAGDGSNRLFVVEQPGVIKVFLNDSTVTSARIFLDLRDRVHYVSGSELGLLGLAFHPSYEDSGSFFVNYTATGPLRTVIARFTVSQNDPDSAVGASEEILLEINQPYTNHNGGQLTFGPDGYLYIALGDGGSGGDPLNNAQNLGSLLGKMLRIDVDNPTGGNAYGIPPDNPYAGGESGYREEIFAHGLRNPWRFSFDLPTGRLWCGDVGESAREEIDLIEKGKNYGWNIMEGTLCYPPTSVVCNTTGLMLPIWEYGRGVGGSITGGIVYRGALISELVGRYVFGDFVSGYLGALAFDGINPPSVTDLDALPQFRLTSFGVDENKELFLCLHDGTILRFQPTVVSSTQQKEGPPSLFHLEQNYPNPFNASTMISFQLSEISVVDLRIHDALGRVVATLVNNELPSGKHTVSWDAGTMPSGAYYCRIMVKTRPGVSSRQMRMLLLR
ncbi:MAG: PQQ-dependent sugar dehydrogenase [Ignavibacteriales bacterium]|nr:PQQ-dependent sugar dehydrogenase [Ignavibacteriales bacterium]